MFFSDYQSLDYKLVDNVFSTSVDLPGHNSETVKVSQEKSYLFIDADNKSGRKSKFKLYLPNKLNLEEASFKMKDGVLNISAPLVEKTTKYFTISD